MKSEFVATCGTYHVMAQLALKQIHAAATFGNAPHVDILVSSADGYHSIAIQVKTARYAKRWRGKGTQRKEHHYEWTLGYKAVKANSSNLFFAFVDLELDDSNEPIAPPTTFIIPSEDLYKFCKDWINDSTWPRFHPSLDYINTYKENWNLIKEKLNDPLPQNELVTEITLNNIQTL